MTAERTVKVIAEVEFRPWHAPNFARLASQGDGTEGIRVADLTPGAIDALAAEWLDNLYAKQARKSPWKLA